MISTVNDVKRQVVVAMLQTCPFLTCAAQHPDAVLPDHIKQAELVILQIGQVTGIMEMPDLAITEQGWSGTLMFRGYRAWCFVPWEAVLQARAACIDGQVGAGFEQVAVVDAGPASRPSKPPTKRPAARRKHAFTVIKGGVGGDSE